MKLITENNKIGTIIKLITDHAHVRAVFGEAQHQGQKTVVPVGRVLLITGGGLGSGLNQEDYQGEGGGGGMILSAKPIGALEISETQTRFVHLNPWQNRFFFFGSGILFGVIVLKWLSSKNKFS